MTTSTGTRRAGRSSTRSSSALAVGGLVAALALAACGTEVAGGSASGLAPLRIGSAAGAQPAADSSGGKLASGWTLDGTLPAGPGSGPVLRFTGAPGEDDVRALAAALGLTAAPDKRAHGWVVDGPTGELRVRSDASGQWSFARTIDCPTYYVDVDSSDGNTGVSCAVAESPGAASDLPLLTDDAALAAAAPVLAAAGVSASPRVLAGAGGQSGTVAVVVADPTVADLPTSGLRSVVDVDAQGVLGATGWLGDLSTDGDYPVVSARTAFDRLDAMPRALADIGCPEIAPGPMESPADDPMPIPCKVDPLVITGATFGLMLNWEDRTPILVPAWLFDVTGWDDPMAQVAVADQYLADPTPLPEPSTGTGGGSAIPPDPGTPETPVAPPTEEPGVEPGGSGGGSDPSTGPGGGGQPGVETPAVEKAFLDTNGTTMALTGWGGVCAEYSAVVDESSTTVKVQIVGRSTLGPDEACIEIAQELKVLVELDSPLGSRTVVDATTGLPVPVTRT
ncbi:hypothetical protein [Longivirga aurantiaca]|uniref:Uncharacterized protein n=1 Tax=Longivirga aurantiaca TaxID=1837743 RepID=A0ABW1T451_9ACTN